MYFVLSPSIITCPICHNLRVFLQLPAVFNFFLTHVICSSNLFVEYYYTILSLVNVTFWSSNLLLEKIRFKNTINLVCIAPLFFSTSSKTFTFFHSHFQPYSFWKLFAGPIQFCFLFVYNQTYFSHRISHFFYYFHQFTFLSRNASNIIACISIIDKISKALMSLIIQKTG